MHSEASLQQTGPVLGQVAHMVDKAQIALP
jgi:hypothetical protein